MEGKEVIEDAEGTSFTKTCISNESSCSSSISRMKCRFVKKREGERENDKCLSDSFHNLIHSSLRYFKVSVLSVNTFQSNFQQDHKKRRQEEEGISE